MLSRGRKIHEHKNEYGVYIYINIYIFKLKKLVFF